MTAAEAEQTRVELGIRKGRVSNVRINGRLLRPEEAAQSKEMALRSTSFPLIEKLASLASQANATV